MYTAELMRDTMKAGSRQQAAGSRQQSRVQLASQRSPQVRVQPASQRSPHEFSSVQYSSQASGIFTA